MHKSNSLSFENSPSCIIFLLHHACKCEDPTEHCSQFVYCFSDWSNCLHSKLIVGALLPICIRVHYFQCCQISAHCSISCTENYPLHWFQLEKCHCKIPVVYVFLSMLSFVTWVFRDTLNWRKVAVKSLS